MNKPFRLFLEMGIFTALMLLFANVTFAGAAPVQITNNPANQGRPDIRGNIIVWKDNRAGNYDIYMYNLATSTESAVSATPAYQNLPVTNGSFVVWQDDRNASWDIYMKDLFLGIEQPLVTGPGNQGLPDIDGNRVVYVDDHAGNNDIYMIDLATRAITPICTNPASQWQPRISGNRVVWEDNRNGNWDIFMKDLATGVESQVSSGVGDNRVADISGDIVVWQSVVAGVADIRMKNLATGVESAVTSDAAYQNSPRISGDLIVWEDYRNGNWDIYMKDLTSGIESPLATGPSTQARPAVDRDKVVYEDTIGGSYDIWMNTVPDVTPPVISAQSPLAGTRTACDTPVISAALSDNRVGVDASSVTLSLDGTDVTATATITSSSVTYQPGSLPAGLHTVTLTAADMSGNLATSTWQFTVAPPELHLSMGSAYWGSYNDYVNGVLSVSYQLANTSTDLALADIQIPASTATSGVIFVSPAPVDLGSFSPGASVPFVLQYLVPGGTTSFKTVVFAAVTDLCGDTHYLPGPPPVR